ncbi:MAG TPA: hypothetical protein VH170_01175 [Chthoniobacterales bacterium]|jgi:hypothetical protein|nr:hypothetical protein [Chthoniobacterales bacterium]
MPAIDDSVFADMLASLEDWQSFSGVGSATLFIAAMGFEDRSPACFESWCAEKSQKKRTAILIEYPFNRTENEVQEARFDEAAAHNGVNVIKLPYDQRSLYGAVIGLTRTIADKSVVAVDLSSLASFALFPVLAAVINALPDSLLDICYSEAADYFPKRVEWESFQAKVSELDLYERSRLFDEQHFQSSGVEVVFECAPFTGHNPDRLPSSVVLVPNFAFERVNRMIDFTSEKYSVPRDRYDWIIGVPPDRERNGWRHDALWQMFDKPHHKHEASTLQYKEILLVLHNLWSERRFIESLTIATTGSKAQHLGTLLFLMMHQEVSLVLSQPKQFIAEKYSEKTGVQWQVRLGLVRDLLEQLVSWNQIIFSW